MSTKDTTLSHLHTASFQRQKDDGSGAIQYPAVCIVDPETGLAVQVSNARQITKTNRSGTIATGGVSQTLMAANAERLGWQIQNNSSGDLWFNEMGIAAVLGQPSFRLSPGEYYESPMNGSGGLAINIIGATTGQTFTAREW